MDCTGCRHLGICCCHSVKINSTVWVLPNVTCEYLDKDTRKCTIYNNRYKNKNCLSMEEAKEKAAIPKECKCYTKEFKIKNVKIASVKKEKKLIAKLIREGA